ncbi:MAG: hypothetical protein ABR577_15050 [Pyrinomonadaceae bacterium]
MKTVTNNRTARYIYSILGAIAALLVLEVSLRPFVSPENGRPDSPSEIRQYREGIATSHFAADGSRLTGNPEISGAETVLILGDSHIEAVHVGDQSTMGSVLERLARSSGHPLNVKQFGWSGVAAPMFMAEAAHLLQLNPARVIVTLNRTDLGDEPLLTAHFWRMKIQPDMSVKLIDAHILPPTATGVRLWLRDHGLTPSNIIGTMAQKSSLAEELIHRYAEINGEATGEMGSETRAETKAPTEAGKIAQASVRGLKEAYGDKLLIAYLPHDVLATNGYQLDEEESFLQAACREEGVRYVSLREAMIAERDNYHRLSRGFENTSLGIGHLNETGHRIAAQVFWQALGDAR